MDEKWPVPLLNLAPLAPSFPASIDLTMESPLTDQHVARVWEMWQTSLQVFRSTALAASSGDAAARAVSGQCIAGVASGLALGLVSYRLCKWKNFKQVLEYRSLAKDVTYLALLYGAAEVTQQIVKECMDRKNKSLPADVKQFDTANSSYMGMIQSATLADSCVPPSSESKIDLSLVKNVAMFGAVGAAPVFHIWYRFLDRALTGSTPATLVAKVALDQAIASSMVTALFLLLVPALEGKSDLTGPDSVLRQKFASIYLTNCAFWPAAQLVNFKFVPPQYRVAYLGLAAFIWTNILCFSRHD